MPQEYKGCPCNKSHSCISAEIPSSKEWNHSFALSFKKFSGRVLGKKINHLIVTGKPKSLDSQKDFINCCSAQFRISENWFINCFGWIKSEPSFSASAILNSVPMWDLIPCSGFSNTPGYKDLWKGRSHLNSLPKSNQLISPASLFIRISSKMLRLFLFYPLERAYWSINPNNFGSFVSCFLHWEQDGLRNAK